MQTYHASVVDVAGMGVMLRGPSGSGKSDLALRLMDRGAVLVADDQVVLTPHRTGLRASAPDKLYGLIEVRGLGIVSSPAIKSTIVRLIIDLVSHDEVPRIPVRSKAAIEGVELDVLKLHSFEMSAPIKIELALRNLDRIGEVEPTYAGRRDHAR